MECGKNFIPSENYEKLNRCKTMIRHGFKYTVMCFTFGYMGLKKLNKRSFGEFKLV